jgi:hypothetical protein
MVIWTLEFPTFLYTLIDKSKTHTSKWCHNIPKDREPFFSNTSKQQDLPKKWKIIYRPINKGQT